MWMFDCEVFKEDWMFVFIDSNDASKREIIVNDSDKLKEFYEKNKDEIFGGYNARSYDQYIFKAILCGDNPKVVNDYIIVKGMNGGSYSKEYRNIELLIYDCMIDKMKSLKQLEGFMGNDIRETTVSFNIDRKLTEEELKEVIKYCVHDVEQTIEVFKRQPEELESQVSLVKAFDLPTMYMNKTKAQLSAIILGAENTGNRHDDYNITFPDTLILSDKYKYIYDWYNVPLNRNDKMSLTTNVMGVPHKFAWGGIHGAITNYSGEGYYIMSDVASLYPSIMIEYDCLSRNVSDRSKYKQIRDKRLELKKAKNPMQLPYKIVLNSTYGASKDKYNSLFDPLMANNVCITGQLLLLDLIDKLELKFGDKCELIQSNTDGILVKLPDKSYYDEYVAVCNDWENRTRLQLEHDIYVRVFQKDVNNYVILDEKGKYKSKGAYVKKLNDLDYDLPIVNKALVNKLIHDVDISETINKCEDLKEFQKIVKIGRDYDYGMFGDEVLSERVLRVFASSDPNDKGIFKFRNDKADKVGNTPEVAFIYNDSVNGEQCPKKLDKQWYIDLANKRYDEFIAREKTDDGIDIYEILLDKPKTFKELILRVKNESFYKNKDFENLIIMGYFDGYGSIKRQFEQFKLFKEVYTKKSMSIEKLLEYGLTIDELQNYGKVCKTNVTGLNGESLFDRLIETVSDKEFYDMELIKLQYERFSCIRVKDKKYKGIVFILDVSAAYETKLKVYALANGNTMEVKIDKKTYAKNIVGSGDIIKIDNFYYKPQQTRNEQGKWVDIPDTKVLWLSEYYKVNL